MRSVGRIRTVAGGSAISAQDEYVLRLPGGVAFADFRGYENWQLVSVSQTDDRLKRCHKAVATKDCIFHPYQRR